MAWKAILEQGIPLAHFACVVHCINEYAVEVDMCVGPSMLPTFNQTGDVVVLDRASPLLGRSLRHHDVVVAKSPTDPHQTVCKRIRAMAGDVVTVRAHQWYLADAVVKVPPGHVWLEGDNPDNSTDSRSYGPVPLAMIRGRVWARLWPPGQIGFTHLQTPFRPRHSPVERMGGVGGAGGGRDGGSGGSSDGGTRLRAAAEAGQDHLP